MFTFLGVLASTGALSMIVIMYFWAGIGEEIDDKV